MQPTVNRLAVNAAITRLVQGTEDGWDEAAQLIVDSFASLAISSHRQEESESLRKDPRTGHKHVEIKSVRRYTAQIGQYTICHVSDETDQTRFITIRQPSTVGQRILAGGYSEFWVGYDVADRKAYLLALARWGSSESALLRLEHTVALWTRQAWWYLREMLFAVKRPVVMHSAVVKFRLAECTIVRATADTSMQVGEQLL